MPLQTWNDLKKTANDDETIEQAIDRIVAEHEADSASHLGVGESLEAHKTADVIDHPAQSIPNDKLVSAQRYYTAIVGTSPECDFADLQLAVDYVHALGGGSILLLAQIHNIYQKVNLYDNVKIVGQDPTATFIDCTALSNTKGTAKFDCIVYYQGTATFTNGSKNVVGVGTAWDTAQFVHGNEIFSNAGADAVIDYVVDATHLVLMSNWATATENNVTYEVYRYGSVCRTVTGYGTTWLTDGIKTGNKIKLNADNQYYYIASVDSETQITLDEDYGDAGGTGAITIEILPSLVTAPTYISYNVGTISVTQDSKTVAGSSTVWDTNILAGQFIAINDVFYEIDTVDSNTSLTLKDYYRGHTLSSLTYTVLPFMRNISLSNFSIKNCSERDAIDIMNVADSEIFGITIEHCNTAFSMHNCNNVSVFRNNFSNNDFNNVSNGLDMSSCYNCKVFQNICSNNTFNGLYCDYACFGCWFFQNTVCNNGNVGLQVTSGIIVSYGVVVDSNVCLGNDALNLGVSEVRHSSITNNIAGNGTGRGIIISEAQYCTIKGNHSYNNGGNGIEIGYSTNYAHRNIIDSNTSYSNTGIGLLITAGGIKNIVTSNILYSNGTNYTDNGTSTTSANNITS